MISALNGATQVSMIGFVNAATTKQVIIGRSYGASGGSNSNYGFQILKLSGSTVWIVSNGSAQCYGFGSGNGSNPGGDMSLAMTFDGTQSGYASQIKWYTNGAPLTIGSSGGTPPNRASVQFHGPFRDRWR